jgi:hypothetical protein
MAAPATNPNQIQSLFPGIQEALQNRTDITTTQMTNWASKTLRELCEKYQFEELHVQGPLITLTPNVPQLIPISSMLNPQDDYCWLDDPVIFLDPPNNTIAYPMDMQSVKAIQTLRYVPGSIPFKYALQGPNFILGGMPQTAYNMYLPYYRRHPFTAANPQQQQLFVPESWHDIVEYAAAERGAIALRWPDMQVYLHQLLYGDPDFEASDGLRGRPGLLAARALTLERVQARSTRQITPFVSRY